ncbi:hypothetical protein F2P79_005494 [Pimephales promelas]|nr:hypothetical protein F2P79_005494 [Pimephales promelas]
MASGAPFNLVEKELAEWKERVKRGWDGGVTVVDKCIKGTRTSTRGCKDGWSNIILIRGKQKEDSRRRHFLVASILSEDACPLLSAHGSEGNTSQSGILGNRLSSYSSSTEGN